MRGLLRSGLWSTAFVISFTSVLSLLSNSLQSSEIGYEIPDTATLDVNPIVSPSVQDVRLQVRPTGLQRSSVSASSGDAFLRSDLHSASNVRTQEEFSKQFPSENSEDPQPRITGKTEDPQPLISGNAPDPTQRLLHGIDLVEMEVEEDETTIKRESMERETRKEVAASDRRSLSSASSLSGNANFGEGIVNVLQSNVPVAENLVSDRRICGEGPLKVYVYDLHQKFNFGLFRHKELESLPFSADEVPQLRYQRKANGGVSGRGFEHSGEFFIVYNLLANNHSDSSRSNGDIIRVTDPAKADVFFVPFLASLSFNIFTTNGMRGALAEKDKILQEELWSVLKESPWWQRSGGRDHIIPMLQPNALRHIRQRLAPAMFLLLDFGRYAQGVARLSKDIVVPYNHMVPPYTEPASYGEAQGPWEARKTLLFFQGTIMRKDEGYIRKLIFDMYHKEPDVRFVESKITGPQDIISAAEGLRNSRFCLNAAGDTPSSARLFDAITSHCVPVVISNKIELPFETSIDYSDFTLFVSHEDALRQGYLLRLLRTFSKERWLRMWRNLQRVKHHFEFQYPSQPGDAVSMVWREIRKKLPRVRLAIHRGKRLVVRDWTNV
ncbi:unnamed protein product [Closterium sp. Yama58-4]|nr:unnamed protein product [Closterium sp. Yama58-4]